MNKVISAVFFLLAVFVLCTNIACAVTVYNAGGLVFRVADDQQNMTIDNAGDFSGITNKIVIIDGKTSSQLNIGTIYNGLSIIPKYYSALSKLSVILEFKNEGTQQRWIEVGMDMTASSSSSWTFWDGNRIHNSTTNMNISRNSVIGTFPAVALFTSNNGICIGLDPMQLISYLASGVQSTNGILSTLNHRVRIVIDPGKSEYIQYIVFGFNGSDKENGIVQRYADSYPMCFNSTTGIDPRILTPSSHYFAWQGYGTTNPENLRRARAGWDWCYAPFKRNGDIYGKEEYWNYTPPYGPIKDSNNIGVTSTTAQEFRGKRTVAFANRSKNFDNAMMFYNPSSLWCEQSLALQEYPDARTNEAGYDCIYSKYVTGWDVDVRMFPGSNSWGDAVRGDLENILLENDISGFAFDVASGEVPVHQVNTPSVALSPGRAYDENGVFVLEAVEVARLMDFVHSKTTLNGHVAGIVSNLGSWGNFMTAFRSDSVISERLSWETQYGPIGPTRYMLGRKTLDYFAFMYNAQNILDWGAIPTARQVYANQGLADYLTLESIAKGTTPAHGLTYYLKGKGPLQQVGLNYMLDAMPELVQRGWNPSPRMTAGNANVWLSRYGKGIQSFIGASNASTTPYNGPVSVVNSANGNLACIFAGYKGEPMQNTLTYANSTIQTNLAAKQFVVGKTVVAISLPLNYAGTITAQASVADNLNEIITTVNFGSINSANYTLTGEIPEGYTLTSFKINGLNKAVPVNNNVFVTKQPLANNSALEMKFTSKYFNLTSAQLLSYPFLGEIASKPVYIIVPELASEDELYAAYRLWTYFDYYMSCPGESSSGFRTRAIVARKQLSGYKKIVFGYDFVTRTETTLSDRIGPSNYIISISKTAGKTTLSDKKIIIQNIDSKELYNQCLIMMRKLDTKYTTLY